jgi:hypothetical protein
MQFILYCNTFGTDSQRGLDTWSDESPREIMWRPFIARRVSALQSRFGLSFRLMFNSVHQCAVHLLSCGFANTAIQQSLYWKVKECHITQAHRGTTQISTTLWPFYWTTFKNTMESMPTWIQRSVGAEVHHDSQCPPSKVRGLSAKRYLHPLTSLITAATVLCNRQISRWPLVTTIFKCWMTDDSWWFGQLHLIFEVTDICQGRCNHRLAMVNPGCYYIETANPFQSNWQCQMLPKAVHSNWQGASYGNFFQLVAPRTCLRHFHFFKTGAVWTSQN